MHHLPFGPQLHQRRVLQDSFSRLEPPSRPDAGRDAGTRQLRDSRFNLLGTYNDDPTGASAVHTRQMASGQGSYGEFKGVP